MTLALDGNHLTLADTCSILVTSHVLAEIERVAHRAAILLDGKLLTVHQLTAAGEARRLRIRVHAADPEMVGACLAQVEGVSEACLEVRDGELSTWRLETADAEGAERVAAALVRSGCGVREITGVASELETLFLKVTTQGASR